jgi:hypothetical protein
MFSKEVSADSVPSVDELLDTVGLRTRATVLLDPRANLNACCMKGMRVLRNS